MNGREHYGDAERLLRTDEGATIEYGSELAQLVAALAHAVLALVETEESSTHEIHKLAETLEHVAEGENVAHPGGLL